MLVITFTATIIGNGYNILLLCVRSGSIGCSSNSCSSTNNCIYNNNNRHISSFNNTYIDKIATSRSSHISKIIIAIQN